MKRILAATVAAVAVSSMLLVAPPVTARAAAPALVAPTGQNVVPGIVGHRPAAERDIHLTLPKPTGPQRVGTVSLHLIDKSRPDPWVPSESARDLMVQVWYPARNIRGYALEPWISPAIAKILAPPGSGIVLPLTHGYAGAPVGPGRHPVVLYSPGLGGWRAVNTAVVEQLASHGYVVVTIDHTHDSQLVEFPGGRVAESAIPQPSDEAESDRIIAKALAVRVADTRFTLDQLGTLNRGHNPDAEHRSLPQGLAGAFDLSRVGMFGVSLGGATAAETMLEDRRIRVGVNLDGTIFGRVLTAGLDQPFLQFGAEPDEGEADDTWNAFWTRLRGPRLEIQLKGSKHLSFTDLHTFNEQSGLPEAEQEPLFGTIDGRRSIAVQRAYALAFFDRYLCHGSGRLLEGPSRRYPELVFVR
jgi:dienelactone hydrolase